EFRHDGEASPTLTIARAGGGGLAFLAFVAALLMVIGFWLAKRTAPATSSAPIPAMSAAPVHVPAISRTPESTSKTVEAIVDSRAELQRLATMWEQALAQDHVRFDVPSPANRGAKFSDVRRALRVARERISQDPSRFSELLRVTNDGVARMQGAWELLGPVDFGLPEEQQSVRTYCVFSKLLESSSKGGGEKKAESARDLHNFCAGLEPNLEDS
ncbi:MAG: hypothetical protein KC492_40310, partial [Myxococcales bacterium]|nr:hypothetical protein [Myxococcales bacterium]